MLRQPFVLDALALSDGRWAAGNAQIRDDIARHLRRFHQRIITRRHGLADAEITHHIRLGVGHRLSYP